MTFYPMKNKICLDKMMQHFTQLDQLFVIWITQNEKIIHEHLDGLFNRIHKDR